MSSEEGSQRGPPLDSLETKIGEASLSRFNGGGYSPLSREEAGREVGNLKRKEEHRLSPPLIARKPRHAQRASFRVFLKR